MSAVADIDYDLDLELTRGRMDGSLIRSKARILLDALAMDAMADIYKDPKAGHQAKMDATKILAEIGDMKPRAQAPQATGTALQINITMPAGALPQPGAFKPADATALPTVETMTIDLAPVSVVTAPAQDDALPPMPDHITNLRMPGFSLSADLVGPKLPTPRT